MGICRFILGAHSADQVIFGWLLGAWIAITYFTLGREHVHRHVTNLVQGRTRSSLKVYVLASTGAWAAIMLTLSVTFLAVRGDRLQYHGFFDTVFDTEEKKKNVIKLAEWDYWNTWA